MQRLNWAVGFAIGQIFLLMKYRAAAITKKMMIRPLVVDFIAPHTSSSCSCWAGFGTVVLRLAGAYPIR
jgi:hypothetical protein